MVKNKEIISLAKRIKINIHENEIIIYKNKFDKFKEELKILNIIDTKNTEPFHYPGEILKASKKFKERNLTFSEKTIHENFPNEKKGYLVIKNEK